MDPSRTRATTWWGAGSSGAVVVLGTGLVLLQRSSLPDRVAVHWAGQTVTGVMPLLGHVALTGVVVAVVGGVLTVLARNLGTAPRPLLTGLAAGCAVFLGGTGYGIALGQRGLSDPYAAENPAASVVGSALVAVAIGMIAARAGESAPAADEQVSRPMLPASAERLRDDADGYLAWRAISTSSPATVLVVSLMVVVPLVLLALVVQDWWLLVLGVGLGVLVASVCVSVVTVDADGLHVRGFGFVPWLRVPLSRIAYADVVEQPQPHPLTGVGLRRTARRGGDAQITFLTRPGPSLRLLGLGAPDVIVSLPDAATAAATVNSLIEHEAVASRSAA